MCFHENRAEVDKLKLQILNLILLLGLKTLALFWAKELFEDPKAITYLISPHHSLHTHEDIASVANAIRLERSN